MERLKRIIMRGHSYPIKIDMNVLEAIQEKYGSINQFEWDILGLDIRQEDGEWKVYKTEPSVKAIKTVLPLMINEGMEIEAEETGKAFCPVTDKEIFRICDISFETLAILIHEEFKRCFATKK